MRIRIGTRGSKLALTQTGLVAEALRAAHPTASVEIIDIKTIGDRNQGTPLASKGDKKDWIYELELGVLANNFDLVVHSGKDIPSDIEAGTETMPVMTRVNPRDCFVGRLVNGRRLRFSEVPQGATVGTASLRRKASLLRLRPDLKIVEHRGNVPTRIEKLDTSADIMGIVLACAGLERLALPGIQWEPFSATDLIPAINQGTLVVQYRSDRDDVRKAVTSLVDPQTFATWQAERGCCEILKGDCKSCISIYAEAHENTVTLISRVMSPDGKQSLEATDSSPLAEARAMGIRLGEKLLSKGAQKIIEASRLC